MDFLTQSILPFLAIILVLLVLHEAGHYFTAKLFGVQVLEAGVGIPPRMWGFTWRGTIYSINALPFGAFVRMLGEEDPSDPRSLAAQPKWKRVIIIGSGAMMNLLVAIALFAAGQMIPHKISVAGAVIGSVVADSPAANAGLQPGDEIVAVNGRDVRNTGDVAYRIQLSRGRDVDFTVERTDPRTGAAERSTHTAYARWDPPTYIDDCGVERSQGATGITLASKHVDPVTLTEEEVAELKPKAKEAYLEERAKLPPDAPARCFSGAAFGFVAVRDAQCREFDEERRREAMELRDELFAESLDPCYEFRPQGAEVRTDVVRSPVWEAVPEGARLSFESVILTANMIWSKIRGFNSGGSSQPLVGLVGIAQATGEVVDEAGWQPLIEFAASISMSLAILNFMPIPAVDGGRLFFIFIEWIRGGKRVSPEKEGLVHLAGLAMLMVVFLVITYFDIVRWVSGDSILR